MSRVNVSEEVSEEVKEVAPVSIPGSLEEDDSLHASEGGSVTKKTRILWECKATADQLAKGHVVQLGNPTAVFDTENAERAIVTEIFLKSAYSDCPEPITLGLNLFNKNATEDNSVNNEHGWLHSPTQTDFGTRVVGGSSGFSNLTGLMPYENTRTSLSIYKPDNAINSRYLKQYGNLSRETLMENVVPFTQDGYYLVDQNHVVLNVIQANWDSLGIDVAAEPRFNSRYVQIPCNVFDKVVDDLETQVLSKLPFSDMHQLACKFSTKRAKEFGNNTAADDTFHAVVEMQIYYTFPPSDSKPSV